MNLLLMIGIGLAAGFLIPIVWHRGDDLVRGTNLVAGAVGATFSGLILTPMFRHHPVNAYDVDPLALLMAGIGAAVIVPFVHHVMSDPFGR